MTQGPQFVLDFKNINKIDNAQVGEYGVLLGDLVNNGFPVPEGFVIPASVYFNNIKNNKFILNLKNILTPLDYSRPEAIISASKRIEEYFLKQELPEDFINVIFKLYKSMGGLLNYPQVSITASFTLTHNYLYEYVKYIKINETHGEANLILNIKRAWANVFRPELLHQNHLKKINPFKFGTAVIVQKLIDYDVLGYLYTKDPFTNNPGKLLITLGDKPLKLKAENDPNQDYIEVNKNDLLITKRLNNSRQKIAKNISLSDKKIIELAKMGKALERQFYYAKKCRWGLINDRLYLIDIKTLDIHPNGDIKPFNNENLDNYSSKLSSPIDKQTKSKTATKIYEHFEHIEEYDDTDSIDSDGIGLIQGDLFIKKLNIHPKAVIDNQYTNDYILKMANDLEAILRNYKDKPVFYSLSDLKTDELRSLSKGKLFEPEETNPLLGFHGAYRHIHDNKILNLEIRVIKYLRDKKGYKNLWLIIPFARNPEELIEIKKILSAHGLHKSANFKIWLMIANIANVVSFDKFIEAGIDGVSINMDYLTMLTLAIDKDNTEMISNYDELNESVLKIIELVIKSAYKHNIDSSIYGHALNLHPNLSAKFVKWGVTSITISPDILTLARNVIAKTEAEMIQKRYYA